MLLLVLFQTGALGQVRFDHVEYVSQTEEKNAHHHALKGSAVFDKEANLIEFMDERNVSVLKIPIDHITHMDDYVKIPLLPFNVHGATHFLTIYYTSPEGGEKAVVINKADRLVKPIEAEIGKIATRREGCCEW
jgi:hypothetical protein